MQVKSGKARPYEYDVQMSEQLKNYSIRFSADERASLEKVAKAAGVTPSDVIRMCVKHGLPVVQHGFEQMASMLKEKLPAKK